MAIYTNRPELKGQPGYIYVDNSQDWGAAAKAPASTEGWGNAEYLGGSYSNPPVPEQPPADAFTRSRVPSSALSTGGSSVKGGTSIDFSRYTPFGSSEEGKSILSQGGITQTGAPLSAYRRNPTQVTTTSAWKGTTPVPTAPNIPTFTPPAWDEGEVNKLTQKYAAAGTRKLRSEVQRASGAYYENPIQRKLTLRDALAGYGEGLENVMAGAAKSAVAEYNPQYAAAQAGAAMTYQANTNKLMQEYNNMMEAWKQQGTGTQTTNYSYDGAETKGGKKTTTSSARKPGVMYSSNPTSRYFAPL